MRGVKFIICFMTTVRCVMVGSGAGKTSFAVTAATDAFPEYLANTVDEIEYDVQVGDTKVKVGLLDTEGENDLLRPLSYFVADVVMICIPIVNKKGLYRARLEAVYEFWFHEVVRLRPKSPIILLGTKLDLRGSSNDYPSYTCAEGLKVAKNIRAAQYLEISSLDRKGVKAAMRCIAEVGLYGQPKSTKCSIA